MNSHTKLIYENNNQIHPLSSLEKLYTNMNSHTKLIYENNNQIHPLSSLQNYEYKLTYETYETCELMKITIKLIPFTISSLQNSKTYI